MTSKLAKVLSSVAFVFVLFPGFAFWWLYTVPFSTTTLQTLTLGMTQAQVAGVLGEARQTNVVAGETWWIYSRKPCVAYLLVRFDHSGFKGYAID